MRRLLLSVFALLIIIAIGMIVYGQSRPLTRTVHSPLEDRIPAAPSGWTRTARAIADTPEMQEKVDELLNFDDGVFYDYISGPLRLSVYVAYWEPGKMSSRLVAGHTPDVCWVGAGWICTARRTIALSDVQPTDFNAKTAETAKDAKPSPPPSDFHPPPSDIPPAEARTFVANGTTEYVWFWHLVDGEAQSYGTGQEPPWHAALFDLIRRGFDQRSEQLFIRLSSPQPLDAPALAPVLLPLLETLPLRKD